MAKRQKRIELSHFKDWEEVANGNYAQVFRAKLDGETVAIKKQQHTVGRGIDERNFFAISIINELRSLRKLGRHPNIVSYMMDISDRTHTYIVMKYYPNTLRAMVKQHKAQKTAFTNEFIIATIHHVLTAIKTAHDSGFVHCDIKPANVFLDDSGAVLGDWGMCQEVPPNGILYLQHVTTLWYRAPELLLAPFGKLTYGYEVDMWSIGCILAEMLLLEPVFQCHDPRSEQAYMDKVCQILGTPTDVDWPQLSDYGDSKIKLSHHDRMDAGFKQKIPTAFHDLLFGMLTFDPSKRMTAGQALRDPLFSSFKT